MSRPDPLFVMGNKRSGSTLTVALLNSHPRLFVSHEADTAWILYQCRGGMPDEFQVHPLDSAMMMTSTIRAGRRILRRTLSDHPTPEELVEAFHQIQHKLMRKWLRFRTSVHGRAWRRLKVLGRKPNMKRFKTMLAMQPDPLHKEEPLAWIGDKKHAQHLDPKIREFLDDLMPNAHHIHIVRNPKGVVASMVEATKTWYVMPEYFKSPAEKILDQWAEHEEWALDAKSKRGDKVLTVKLEDLCMYPEPTLERMYEFLGLEMTDAIRRRIPLLVYPWDPNKKYESFPLPDVPRARRIMELYGYS